MNSPLTDSKNTKLEKKTSTEYIINQYRDSLNIDVSRLFKKYKSVYLYKCLDTNYRFFYPFDIIGDSKFYEDLQKFNWYYMSWKWEYEQTMPFLKNGMKILEIGCGNGAFLKRISESFNLSAIGLEINDTVLKIGEKSKFTIKNESIQNHSADNSKKYDIVCCFQIIEHIPEVRSFIKASLECLKQGGYFIVSVPNNNSFILKNFENVLNMPPHHLGLWDIRSLKSISKTFNLSIVKIKYEPLQKYHYIYANMYIDKLPINTYLKKIFKRTIPLVNKVIPGHSIFIVYKKN